MKSDRSWEFENQLGNLLIAQYHSKRLCAKLHSIFVGPYPEPAYHYIRLDNNKWYKISISIEQTDAPHDVDSATYNYLNLLGQIFVSDYQIKVLRERLGDSTSKPGQASEFNFKNRKRWYSIGVKCDEEELPDVEEKEKEKKNPKIEIGTSDWRAPPVLISGRVATTGYPYALERSGRVETTLDGIRLDDEPFV